MSGEINSQEMLRIRANLGIHSADEAAKYAKFFAGKPKDDGKGASAQTAAPQAVRGAARMTYHERVKMDSLLGQPEFGIKTFWQVARSMLSFSKTPPDNISRKFVKYRLPEFYSTIEQLVLKVRLLMPRADTSLISSLRTHSVFSFNVLSTIQRWNLSKISHAIARLQSIPGSIRMHDLSELLWLIYRPIMMMDSVVSIEHIPFALDKLYFIIAMTAPGSFAKSDREALTTEVVKYYSKTRLEVRYFLYPALMKIIGAKMCPYETFFNAYRNQILDFLSLKDEDIIKLPRIVQPVEEEESDNLEPLVEKPAAPALDASEEIMMQGLTDLAIIFPESELDKPWNFPDYYQYFSHVYSFPKSFSRIDRRNPVLQIVVISHILQDLFFGWNSIQLNCAAEIIRRIEHSMEHWYKLIENVLYLAYAKALDEYYDYFTTATQFRQQAYGDKVFLELGYITKTTLLPHVRFNFPQSLSFTLQEREPLYGAVASLYEDLHPVFINLSKDYSAEKSVLNPADKFIFEVPNNVSRRLFSILDKSDCTNERLIKITFEILGALNYLMHDENSWAYTANPRKIFRSSDEGGIVPEDFIDAKIDPISIFRANIDETRKKAAEKMQRKTRII